MLKKIVLWILEIFLIFEMAACSSERSENTNNSMSGKTISENTANQNSIGTEESENPESGMQYVYSSMIVDFAEDSGAGILSGSDVAVHDIAGRGDQVYVLLEVREWGEEPEDNTQKTEYTSYYQVFSCMADGSEKAVSGQICLPESGGYVNDLYLSDDGCVAALFYSDADESVSLLFWNPFQDVHWKKQIAAGGYLFFREDGFVLLARKGEGREINFYDSQGELADSVEADGEIFSNFQDCYFMPDNRFLVIAADNEGAAYAKWYDPKSGGQERRMLPDIFSRYRIFQGTTADILLCDSAGIYQLESDRNVPTELFSYVDADLDIDGFQMVQQLDGRRFAGIFNDGGVPRLGLFERSEVPKESQKQIVILGTMSELEAGLRRQIISFNQENSQYRITVKQYVTYNEEVSALVQLNTDILSGNMPDILLIDNRMPLQSYITKDLLADVGYPSENREGSCIRICGMGFALSGRSARLDGAWEFVRYFLTEDFQRNRLYEINQSGLSIRRDIFREEAQRAATQEGYCFINDEYFPVLPMTQGQIDRAVGFIENLHNPAFEDEVIMGIIYEEAESFFQGQKTAEDVAGLIQNRVQLYLSEGR